MGRERRLCVEEFYCGTLVKLTIDTMIVIIMINSSVYNNRVLRNLSL